MFLFCSREFGVIPFKEKYSLSKAKILPVICNNLKTVKKTVEVTCKKSHRSCRVPKSVTLNDLERRNNRRRAAIILR